MTLEGTRSQPTAALATSPLTGWDRARWAAFGDGLLAAVRPYASAGHARITLPGPEGGYAYELAIDGALRAVRTPDGLHLNVAGSRRLAGRLLGLLIALADTAGPAPDRPGPE